MSFPAQFLGDISELEPYRKAIEYLPKSIAGRIESYHLDSPGEGQQHMAALVKWNGKFCDFFAPLQTSILVIEDTGLYRSIKEGLSGKEQIQNDLNTVAVRLSCEFLDKAKGSTRILDALYIQFFVNKQGGEKNPPQANCEFWLVVTDTHEDQENDVIVYDAIISEIRKTLETLKDETTQPYVSLTITDTEEFSEALEKRIK